jgi:hypothetical protein
MKTLRFGRKLNLPSTMAIKHQVRRLMAQHDAKQAEAEARVRALPLPWQPGLVDPSVRPAAVIDNKKISRGVLRM